MKTTRIESGTYHANGYAIERQDNGTWRAYRLWTDGMIDYSTCYASWSTLREAKQAIQTWNAGEKRNSEIFQKGFFTGQNVT